MVPVVAAQRQLGLLQLVVGAVVERVQRDLFLILTSRLIPVLEAAFRVFREHIRVVVTVLHNLVVEILHRPGRCWSWEPFA